MKFPTFSWKDNSRWLLIITLVIMVFFILWNLFLLVQQTEGDERQRMELWALAQQQFTQNIDLNEDVNPIIFNVLTSENNIPMIVVDADDRIVSFNNIDPQVSSANANGRANVCITTTMHLKNVFVPTSIPKTLSYP